MPTGGAGAGVSTAAAGASTDVAGWGLVVSVLAAGFPGVLLGRHGMDRLHDSASTSIFFL
jgi:hypothetical protein